MKSETLLRWSLVWRVHTYSLPYLRIDFAQMVAYKNHKTEIATSILVGMRNIALIMKYQ